MLSRSKTEEGFTYLRSAICVGKIDVRSGKKNGSTSLENDNMCYVSFRIRAYLGVVKFKSKIRSSWEDF